MRYEIDIEESEGKWVLTIYVIKHSIDNIAILSSPVSFQVFDTEQEAKEAESALKKLLI